LIGNKSSIGRKLKVIILIIIAAIIVGSTVSITYAVNKNNDENTNVVVKVLTDNDYGNDKVKYQVKGNLFRNILWYPGHSEGGLIRIENKLGKDININNIGIKVTIAGPKNTDVVYQSFLNNMHFTVNSTKSLILRKNIIDDKTINQVLYKDGNENYKGSRLEEKDKITIKKGEDIYFQYSLTMDTIAGNELMDLSANLELAIDFDEIRDKHEDKEKK
jgi:hypothetical protein